MAFPKERITITSNFSFLKLASKIDEIEEGFTSESSEAIVEMAAKLINSKKVTPKLADSTIARREARGNYDDTPLKDTGNLVESLKVVKGGFEFADYGLLHQYGNKRPLRRFLPFTKDGKLSPDLKKFQRKLEKLLTKRMNKTMKR